MRLCKITCLVPIGVRLEDLNVHLAGRGSTAIVSADSADKSSDLKSSRHMVRVEHLPEPTMPIWPFMKASPSVPVPPLQERNSGLSEQLEEIRKVQREIRDMLLNSSVQSIPTAAFQAEVGRSSGPSDPIFIPSQIVPDVRDEQMKIRESEADKPGLEEDMEILKKLRRGS